MRKREVIYVFKSALKCDNIGFKKKIFFGGGEGQIL